MKMGSAGFYNVIPTTVIRGVFLNIFNLQVYIALYCITLYCIVLYLLQIYHVCIVIN